MYCSNCGKHNAEDGKFCQFCGTKLVRISTRGKSVAQARNKDGIPQIETEKPSPKDKTNIISNYFNVIKKYVDFKGRASRKEYWLFILANFIIAFGLGCIEGLARVAPESGDSMFVSIYQLFIALPSLAVGVRRMHDTNKSGWVIVVPIYNFIITLRKGSLEANKYGSPPLD